MTLNTITKILIYCYSIHPTIAFPIFFSKNCGNHRGFNQKVISFSYFGNGNNREKGLKIDAYREGLFENARKIPEIYGSDWIMRIYTNDSTIKKYFRDFKNVDLCDVSEIKISGNKLAEGKKYD